MGSRYWPGHLLVTILVGGCSEPFQCTQSIEPAITVAVTDSVTGEPVAEGALGAIRERDYVDSLRPRAWDGEGRLTELQAGDERPGTYVVEVRQSGYAARLPEGVQATSGQCHVQTVALKARLQQTP